MLPPTVHLIPSGMVNCYLIDDPVGLTLIDTGLPRNEKRIAKMLASLGKSITDIRHILITHADGDHVGSLKSLKAQSGATVYASAGEAQAIAKGEASRDLIPPNVFVAFLFKFTAKLFAYDAANVDVILKPGDTLPMLGGLEVIPTPGHTPDHISFYSASTGVLFAGDSMRASKGRLVTSSGANTIDEDAAKASVAVQRALQPKFVCVGHGDVTENASERFPSS